MDTEEDEITHSQLRSNVKLLIWMTAIVGVFMLANVFRAQLIQNNIDQLDEIVTHVQDVSEQTSDIASETKISADAALAELRAAIKAINESNADEPDLTNQAIIDALQAIARIEGFVCGGPCPEPNQ